MPSKKGSRWNISRTSNPRYWEYHKNSNPNLTQEECENLASDYRKSCNKGNIKYYERYFPELTHEEHLALLNRYKLDHKKTCKNNIEWWHDKYPDKDEDEILKLYSEHMRGNNHLCIEYFEKRYPELTRKEHLKLLERERVKYNSSAPRKFGKDNPGHKSNCSVEDRRKRSPKCIEFYTSRYPDKTPEECEEMRQAHLKLTASRITPDKHSTRVEYWLKKGYTESQAREIISNMQRTFTLDYCIEKYGEEEGRKRFEQRQDKWLKSLRKHFEVYGDGRSAQSEFATYLIGSIYNKLGLRKPLREKWMTSKDGHNYSYDFCHKNIIIEFNGDYWHMNPILYKDTDINKTTHKTAAQKWQEDAKKIQCATDNGYKVLVIWENEFNESRSDTLQKCLDFIHENMDH